MTLKVHFTISAAVGLAFGLIFKSYFIGMASWLIGWAIDFDHLMDYFIYLLKFKTRPNLGEFLSGDFFKKLGKIYILAHGWEYLILFITVGSFTLPWQLVLAIALSYSLHLFLDQLACNTNKWMYFLIYRIKVNFNVNKLCRD
ncbi:hypothetical protein KJ636_04145 [Patescibacteria group bacterium]|nr:hypothetical protein [Patescibacteria group bacterium]MBU4480741.1 hypothetical protein [Patescibacteria group bacterium]